MPARRISAADALVADLRAIGGHEACLLVAHSLGAAVATAAAEAAPELVAGLVYVSGLVPVNGVPAGAYNDMEEMRDSLLPANFAADPFVIGALRGDMLDPSRRASAQTLPAPALPRTVAAVVAQVYDRKRAQSGRRAGSVGPRARPCRGDRGRPGRGRRRAAAVRL